MAPKNSQTGQEIGERDASARTGKHQAFALSPINQMCFIALSRARARFGPKFDSLDCKFLMHRLFDSRI
jgi:hypothetical protein